MSTPYLIRPIEWGADIVVHSATKYLGGHGTAIGGVIVDSGNFDFGKRPGAVPRLQHPGPQYNGLVYARRPGRGRSPRRQPLLHPQGPRPAASRPRLRRVPVQRLPDCPGHGDAEPSGGTARGERRRVARWLEARDDVESVAYAGPAVQPVVPAGRKYAPKGTGAVVAFESSGGAEAGKRFVDALELFATWPTSATSARWSSTRRPPRTPALRRSSRPTAGVTPGLVRLSVGIEHIDDIIADLEAGFRAAKSAEEAAGTGQDTAGSRQ